MQIKIKKKTKKIPPRFLKEVSEICSPFLSQIWNSETVTKKDFLTNLNIAAAIPVFKKKYF